MREQDERFFKHMEEQRKFEEELLTKDREETTKAFQYFIQAISEKMSPSSINSTPNFFSPTFFATPQQYYTKAFSSGSSLSTSSSSSFSAPQFGNDFSNFIVPSPLSSPFGTQQESSNSSVSTVTVPLSSPSNCAVINEMPPLSLNQKLKSGCSMDNSILSSPLSSHQEQPTGSSVDDTSPSPPQQLSKNK